MRNTQTPSTPLPPWTARPGRGPSSPPSPPAVPGYSRPRVDHRGLTLLFLVFLFSACASAGDRLEQGLEAEAYGRWHQAANRYIDALEKEARMTEARDRLQEAGDSAIAGSLLEAESRLLAGDPVGAGEEFFRMDRLLARANSVGVLLPTPDDFEETRRATFDAAIAGLFSVGQDARVMSRWDAGRRAFRRIRNDFEPSVGVVRQALDAEARLLLDWALAEEDAQRFRSAFGLAAEALGLGDSYPGTPRDRMRPAGGIPADVEDGAVILQDRALIAGTAGIVVFPVSARSGLEAEGEADLTQLLSDILELDHWRRPPLFIAVTDPVVVRAVTRRLTPAGTHVRPGRIVDELGAAYGVLIDITALAISEEDVRRRTRTVRTGRGATADFFEEEGTLRYEVQAEISVVDRFGREWEDFPASGSESGSFERGSFEGDYRTLQLSRGEARLFDPVVQAGQRAAIEEALMARLAETIAEQVFRRVLNRIP